MATGDLRSGTSPVPNQAEARGAESSADFVHKLKVARIMSTSIKTARQLDKK